MAVVAGPPQDLFDVGGRLDVGGHRRIGPLALDRLHGEDDAETGEYQLAPELHGLPISVRSRSVQLHVGVSLAVVRIAVVALLAGQTGERLAERSTARRRQRQ